MNNNINITPLLCFNGHVGTVNNRPAFLLNTHSTGSILRHRLFRRMKHILVAARSNSRNRGNFMAGRSMLTRRRFSHVSAYKPGPVVVTITHCTFGGSVRYRMSLRGGVTYNIKTYLYYMRGAIRNGGYMYGRNPMVGVGGLA